jgi:hypothetical protein
MITPCSCGRGTGRVPSSLRWITRLRDSSTRRIFRSSMGTATDGFARVEKEAVAVDAGLADAARVSAIEYLSERRAAELERHAAELVPATYQRISAEVLNRGI